jgi:hypothetical protein
MTDSFVVSSGGSVNGGGDPITLDNTVKKLGAFFFPAYPHIEQAMKKSSGGNIKGGLVAVAVVALILNIILIAYATTGIMYRTGAYSEGIGARGAGTGDLKFSYPLHNQGMTNKTKYDTFMSGQEPPSFNDVPNYILRKENRMQDALATYANLRSSGHPVPDWAEYWNNWQTDNNYSYTGQSMYDTDGKGMQISGKGAVKGKYYAQEQKELDGMRSRYSSDAPMEHRAKGMSSARLGLAHKVY